MAKNIEIKKYNNSYREKWDAFVMKKSCNGTFLQTRNFLEYHPKERFIDASLIFLNGTDIVAVMPANIVDDIIVSHQGSTFGGLVVSKQCLSIQYIDQILIKLNEFLTINNIKGIKLKQTSNLFTKYNTDLIDYFLFKDGYTDSLEVGFYIDFEDYAEDIISDFSSSRRRDYKYSLKNGLEYKQLTTKDEIKDFYDVLCDNYVKFGKKPVHTLEELYDFKFDRLTDKVEFYGVFHEKELIAGGMIFLFNNDICHTQYLAVKQDMNNLFANEFLYTNLIQTARDNGYKKFSFGTSTLDEGKVLNIPLALYKEGFGMKAFVNKSYTKYT